MEKFDPLDHSKHIDYKNPRILILVLITAMASDIAYRALSLTKCQADRIKDDVEQIAKSNHALTQSITLNQKLIVYVRESVDLVKSTNQIRARLMSDLNAGMALVEETTELGKITEQRLKEAGNCTVSSDCEEVVRTEVHTCMKDLQECAAALKEYKEARRPSGPSKTSHR